MQSRNMEPAIGAPAPYGHACAGCSKAKSKCITRVRGPCERCHRLGKECTPAALLRKRRPRKPTPAVRKSQLEDKLSDLVSLLQSQHLQLPANSINLGDLVQEPKAPLSPRTLDIDRQMYLKDWNYQGFTPITMASKSIAHVSPIENDPGVYLGTASHLKAEQDLDMFKTHHLKYLPLIYLPNEITVGEIQRQRPFLWLNIQAICERSHSKQTELGVQIRQILATKVVVEGERSMDLLLGLLVFTSWSFYFASGKPLLGMSSSIAKSLVIDLRLDISAGGKPPADGLATSFNCKKPWSFMEPCESNHVRTNEERRALLATYVLTVSLSVITGHDNMRWGPQMEEAILGLGTAEWPGDEILVALARLSRISDDAATLIRYGPDDPERAGPALIHVKHLSESLNQIKSSLSTILLQNKTVASYLYNAQVIVHEIALFQPPLVSSRPYDFRRFEYLHTCVQATRSGLDNFLSVSPSDWIGLNFSVMLHFSHSIQVMHRLSCLQSPGWDRALIRATVNVLDYLEMAAVRMEQAYANWNLDGVEEGTSVFRRGAQVMRAAVPIWAASLENADKADERERIDVVGSEMDETLMEFSDETWFTDFFGSWNV